MIVRRFALIRAVLLSLALVASIPGTVGAQSFTNPLGCGAQPTDFRVTTFRSGLNFPYGMHRLADGSLLVATSRPNTSTSGYFDSVGELLRLVDTNGDGVA